MLVTFSGRLGLSLPRRRSGGLGCWRPASFFREGFLGYPDGKDLAQPFSLHVGNWEASIYGTHPGTCGQSQVKSGVHRGSLVKAGKVRCSSQQVCPIPPSLPDSPTLLQCFLRVFHCSKRSTSLMFPCTSNIGPYTHLFVIS